MDTGLYNGVAAMNVAERRLDSVTANLSNLNTPAYKRRLTASQAFRVPGGGPDDFEIRSTSITDFAQGQLEKASSPYSLALRGAGFFALEAPDGPIYTRRGDFHMDQNGVLRSHEGHAVAWEGRRGRIDPVGELVTIDGGGTVRQGELELGRLRVVDFAEPGQLADLGGELYRAPAGVRARPSTAEVHQGMLEGSNAASVDELVSLIQVQRSFEASSQLLQMIDQTYRRLTAQQ